MVKKVLKFVSLLLFFIFALILFVPKDSFYYLLEQNLKKFDLIISNEKLEDKTLSLDVQNLDISAKEIKSLSIKKANIKILGIYNSVELQNIQLSSLVENYLPAKINKVDVYYTILHPLVLQADGHGKFGNAKIAVNILDKNVTLILKPSKVMFSKYRNSLREFKKSKNGEYIYEKSL